ncbi:biotin transporter BioY [Neomicrococcus lactis]
MTSSTPSTTRSSATNRRRFGAQDIALIAVFAALIAALTLVPAIPVGPLGVPITLQTFGVAVAALVLGAWRGFCAVGLYLIAGFAGLPVFAKFSAGLGVLAGPSAGYLISFPITALITGALATYFLRRTGSLSRIMLFVAAIAGSIISTHPLGILGMSINGHIPLDKAFLVDMAYWPGDIIKSLLAALIAAMVFKAFPRFARRNFS